jgi:hypothetical protein
VPSFDMLYEMVAWSVIPGLELGEIAFGVTE